MRLKNWDRSEVELKTNKITLIHQHLYFELKKKLYNYPLIAPFDIFSHQEVNWIYN